MPAPAVSLTLVAEGAPRGGLAALCGLRKVIMDALDTLGKEFLH